MLQWYSNAPACVKAKLKLSPFFIFPESNKPDVIVCSTLSLFVHVTVAPFATVISAGLNAKLAMSTEAEDAGAGAAWLGAGCWLEPAGGCWPFADAGGALEYPAQPRSRSADANSTSSASLIKPPTSHFQAFFILLLLRAQAYPAARS